MNNLNFEKITESLINVFLEAGQITKDIIADTETKKLVISSEFLSPIYFPKKPEIIDATSGRNKSEISILTF